MGVFQNSRMRNSKSFIETLGRLKGVFMEQSLNTVSMMARGSSLKISAPCLALHSPNRKKTATRRSKLG
jgi:hypothetical protein